MLSDWMHAAKDNYFSSGDSFLPKTAAKSVVIFPLQILKCHFSTDHLQIIALCC